MERQRMSAVVSFVVALGILAAGILGPLFLEVIRFRLPAPVVNQYVGGEIVTVFVAVPALVVAVILWLSHDRLAPSLAIGPAAYTVYTFITAIIGQDYPRHAGNAERAFPLYAALIFGGVVIVLVAITEIAREDVPVMPDGLRKATASVFLAIALFFAVAWTSQISQVYRGQYSTEYLDGPTLFWLIKLMDLAFLLPLFGLTGIGMLRNHPIAIRLAYAIVGYAVCMASAILGMAIAMVAKDDPATSTAMIALLGPVTAALAFLAWRTLSHYRHGQEAQTVDMTSIASLGLEHAG